MAGREGGFGLFFGENQEDLRMPRDLGAEMDRSKAGGGPSAA
jgi:hypothetical protein